MWIVHGERFLIGVLSGGSRLRASNGYAVVERKWAAISVARHPEPSVPAPTAAPPAGLSLSERVALQAAEIEGLRSALEAQRQAHQAERAADRQAADRKIGQLEADLEAIRASMPSAPDAAIRRLSCQDAMRDDAYWRIHTPHSYGWLHIRSWLKGWGICE